MEVQIAVSKVNKYASSESGDTVEVIERPNGGLSVVLADGQSSGKGAKWISTMVVRKVISLLSEGVRDGAAARAASDYLYTERRGKVSATLNIVSVDMQTGTLVITRNNPAPVLLSTNDNICLLEEESQSIGIYRGTRPLINEIPLDAGTIVIIFSDGITHAGSRDGQSIDITTCVESLLDEEEPTAETIADTILKHAVMLDQGRPVDDISIVVLQVSKLTGDNVRRMKVRLPLV
jgi:serine phosphatase RsbU (regulator of sigma subunit)